MTTMLQVCSDFRWARVSIVNTRPDELKREGHVLWGAEDDTCLAQKALKVMQKGLKVIGERSWK